MSRCWEADPKDRSDFGDIYVDIAKRHQKSLELEETPIYVEAVPLDPGDVSLQSEKHNGEMEPEPLSATNAAYSSEPSASDEDQDAYMIPDRGQS